MEFEIAGFSVLVGLILWNLKLNREHCRSIHHIEKKLGIE